MTDMSAIGVAQQVRPCRADRPSRSGRHAGSRGREAGNDHLVARRQRKTSLLHAWPTGRATTTGSPSRPYGRDTTTRSCPHWDWAAPGQQPTGGL